MYSNSYHVPHKRDSISINYQFRNNTFNNRLTQNQQHYNNDFWCETCDRGFKTKNILEDHKKQHQKCNIDGCQFFAHPKVIIRHVQMQHSTGLYKKIAKLNNPEEIEKWIQDRKKKYPTKANIEKKVLEVKEKINRGEKMGIGSVRKQKDLQKKRKWPYDYTKKQNIPNKILKKETTPRDCQQPKKNCNIISISSETRKLKPFPGIQQLFIENNDKDSIIDVSPNLIEDDEFVSEGNQEILPTCTSQPVLCGALTSLINEYGSSDEDEIDNNMSSQVVAKAALRSYSPHHPPNLTISSSNDKIEVSNKTIQSKTDAEDDSGPEEIKVVKVDSNPSEEIIEKRPYKQHTNKYPKEKQQINNKKILRNSKHKVPSTLLEKLLCNEIRQERNIILQCIRHVIKNNYFNKSL